jgi:hypothetical protein
MRLVVNVHFLYFLWCEDRALLFAQVAYGHDVAGHPGYIDFAVQLDQPGNLRFLDAGRDIDLASLLDILGFCDLGGDFRLGSARG